jgi:hypothetical protein
MGPELDGMDCGNGHGEIFVKESCNIAEETTMHMHSSKWV